jgi:DEAD/DEAH box helicase domain-containing protein
VGVSEAAEYAGRGARDLVDRLVTPSRQDRLTHLEVLPPRAPTYARWPDWVTPELRTAYAGRGVDQPWLHQVIGADAAVAGHHVVLATGTASGKSLAYQLPAITAILESRGLRNERGAAALYIAPTKALAQDQLAALQSLGLDVRATTHDGDSPREQRDWARDHGEYLLTNPDMLHRSMLPAHTRWARFFASLRYVVVDECHH